MISQWDVVAIGYSIPQCERWSGGSGADNGSTANTGGSTGRLLRKLIMSPASSYFHTVGAVGSAGTAGTSGFAGGAGVAGLIIVTAHWE